MRIIRMLCITVLFSILICGCSKNGGTVNNETLNDASKDTSAFEIGKGTFYYPDEMFNNYKTVEKKFDGTPQGVVDILSELGNYGDADVRVNGWHISDGVLYIDFNRGLIDATGSTAQEYFSILGTVKTLKSCFGVKYVRLTINSEDFNTEHGCYDFLM